MTTTTTARRSLLTLADLNADDITGMAARAASLAQGAPPSHALKDRIVGVYFRKTSTRTRTAFTVGAMRLGAKVIAYGPQDLQENTGESAADTGRVLGSMLDALVARTAGDPAELRAFASGESLAVINAMSADEHPTQALADLATVLRHRGSLDGLRMLYVGEGNNTASALALALARIRGARLELRTPPGYGVLADKMELARELAIEHDVEIVERHDMDDLPRSVDIVYTTRWQTTGTSKPDPNWRDVFAPFQVDERVMELAGCSTFMHDLPAHRGEEVTSAVLDGPASIAFDQAEMKLYGAMAALEWAFRDH
jgi:ornithine carbamoyltransferase